MRKDTHHVMKLGHSFVRMSEATVSSHTQPLTSKLQSAIGFLTRTVQEQLTG
jgi:hypothetical protein